MQETPLEQQLKELSGSLNSDIHFAQVAAKQIARGAGGREVALAITKMQEAKMWVEQALKEIANG